MTASAEDRRIQRVFSGFMPPMFDMVVASYPDAYTEVYVYSMKNTNKDADVVTGVLEVKYLDVAKTQIDYAKRTL